MNYGAFRCLSCGGSLVPAADRLTCEGCQREYRIDGAAPVLMPDQAQVEALRLEEGHPVTLAQYQAIYDRVYSHDGLMGTDLDQDYDRATKEALLSFGGALDGKRVLDLGAGVGNLWRYVPDAVDGYAVELSLAGVRKIAERFPHVTVSVSLGEFLPYPDGYFDLVVAADTIEHTLSPERTIDEIHRVLRQGGVLGASFPIPNSLRKWGRNRILSQRPDLGLLLRLARVLIGRTLLFGRPDFQPIDRDQEPQQWAALLDARGFTVDQVRTWPVAPQVPIVTLVGASRR